MIKTLFRRHWLFFSIIFSTLFLLYLPQLTGEFIGDDVGRIFDVPPTGYFSFLYSSLGDRPLLVVLMWLDKIVFGLHEFGMKFENLVIVAMIFVAFRILINRMGAYFSVKVNPLLRDSILFLFAIHPLNIQAFGHVIQRGALLATLLSIVATWLLIYCRGNPKRFAWKLALLLWCLALMAKPNIAFMPVWWGLILWFGGDRKRIPYLLIFLLMLFIPVAGYILGGFNPQSGNDNLTNWEYFLTQGRVIAIYLKLLVWPDNLYFIYEMDPSRAKDLFPGLYLWILYLGAFGIYLYFGKNKAAKLFFIGGFLAFIPESSFFKIIHLVFEHRSFTPFLLMLSSLSFLNLKVSKKALLVVVVIIAVPLMLRNFERSRQISTYETWALHDFSQGSCKIPYNIFYVGHQFLKRGNTEGVEKIFKTLDNCIQDTVAYPLLKAERDLVLSKVMTDDVLESYKTILHSDNSIMCIIRNQSNLFFIENTLRINREDSPCYTEDMISHQLKYIVQFPSQCSASIDFYFIANSACLRNLLKDPKKNEARLLKLRTIRNVYFNLPDVNLRADLKAASDKDEVKYLLDLHEKASRQKEDMLKHLKKN